MEKICLVYVTTAGREEAVTIGDELVKRKLAACVNIHDKMTSIYVWEGKKEMQEEAVLLIKTRESLLEATEKAVKELHSYDCPCFISLPVDYSSREYREWIIRQTSLDERD